MCLAKTPSARLYGTGFDFLNRTFGFKKRVLSSRQWLLLGLAPSLRSPLQSASTPAEEAVLASGRRRTPAVSPIMPIKGTLRCGPRRASEEYIRKIRTFRGNRKLCACGSWVCRMNPLNLHSASSRICGFHPNLSCEKTVSFRQCPSKTPFPFIAGMPVWRKAQLPRLKDWILRRLFRTLCYKPTRYGGKKAGILKG